MLDSTFLEKKIHFLGSCGTLMAGLCQLADDLKLDFSGSDKALSPPMSNLIPRSCQYTLEDKKYLEADYVVVGNVFKYTDDIIRDIRMHGIKIISSMDFLSVIIRGKTVIAVCGTHGKSTTTSLVSWIMQCAGLEPSYLIGAQAKNFSKSARISESTPYFIIEADEYDIAYFDKRSKMHTLWPTYILANTIEFDHADIFRSEKEVIQAFDYFFRRVDPRGKIFALDNLPSALGSFSNLQKISTQNSSFVFNKNALYKGSLKIHDNRALFGPVLNNIVLADAICRELGIADHQIEQGISSFLGVERRSQHVIFKDVSFWVDFAHHPTAIDLFIESVSSYLPSKFKVLIEKGSNSMTDGIFDSQLKDIVLKYHYVDFTWMQKSEQDDQVLSHFVQSCVDSDVPGIILTNNPYRWSQIQCVFSTPSLVE